MGLNDVCGKHKFQRLEDFDQWQKYEGIYESTAMKLSENIYSTDFGGPVTFPLASP